MSEKGIIWKNKFDDYNRKKATGEYDEIQLDWLINNMDGVIKKAIEEHPQKADDKAKYEINVVKSILFNDKSKIILKKTGLISSENIWELELFTDYRYRRIIDDAIEWLKKAIASLEKNDNKKTYDENLTSENKYLPYNDLSAIYRGLLDYDKFVEYASKAVERGSIASAGLLTKYYIDIDDYTNAYACYHKCIHFNVSDNMNVPGQIQMKLVCCTNMYFYLFNHGLYEEALQVNEKSKELLSQFNENDVVLDLKEEINNREKNCNERIEELSKQKYNDVVLNDYFEEDVINMMTEDIKIYISTSLNVYNYINNSGLDMDYSAALIPIMKGVENILFEVFVNHYVEYLKENVKSINLNDIVDRFKFKDKYINNRIDRCEYGDAKKSIAEKDYDHDTWIIKKTFKDFYLKNKEDDSFEKNTIEFLDRLNKLNDKRNKVAHKNRILKADAEEGIKELIEEHINFIELLYTYFDFCFK